MPRVEQTSSRCKVLIAVRASQSQVECNVFEVRKVKKYQVLTLDSELLCRHAEVWRGKVSKALVTKVSAEEGRILARHWQDQAKVKISD